MLDNIKKVLPATIAILILGIFSFGLYKYFFPPAPAAETPPGETPVSPPSFPQSGNAPAPAPVRTSTTTWRSNLQVEVGSLNSNIKIVSNRPVAGAIFVERPTSGSTVKQLFARYMGTEDGHISDLIFNGGLAVKISNTTITRVVKSIFNTDSSALFMRRFGDNGEIQNIFATLEMPATATSTSASTGDSIGKLNQSLLTQDIREVAASPQKDKIFYLTNIGGDSVGTTESFLAKQGGGKKQVFSSPLGEWQVSWPENNTLFFNTKPSANIPGFLYSLKLNGGGLNKILSGINGLTSNVSPSMKKILYAESVSGGIANYIYDTAKKESIQLQIKTLPEKCVWGGVEKNILYCAIPKDLPRGNYPDDWYQGLISLNDELWKIDATNGNSELIIDQSTLGRNGDIDATSLVLSPSENYILTINKRDSSLWQIKLK